MRPCGDSQALIVIPDPNRLPMKPQKPTVIVLGAGRGSRFRGGGHKLARPWSGGTVFEKTLSNALASGLRVTVVTIDPLVHLAAPHVARRDILVLPDAASGDRLGMGYSIAAGVTSTLDSPGWLILPADMPLVRPKTLQQVASGLGEQPVVYPQFLGRRGHPVGFSPELISELTQLQGDEGARRIVARYPSRAIDVDDPGVLQDFDTEDDFLQAERTLAAIGAASSHS